MSGGKPTWEDEDGDELHASGTPGAGLLLSVITGERVLVDDLERFVLWLYKRAGRVPPVMLGRPIILSSEAADCGPFRVRLCGNGVCVEAIRVAGPALEPGEARRLAALICSYADAAEAEPDPAEVDALATVLMEGNPGAMGLGGARPMARRILAAGYRRGERDA